MKQYTWILFDADDTLFHFDAFSGLKLMFSHFGIQFTADDYEEYQTVNQPLWTDYQNGGITASELQSLRFTLWANRLQCDPQLLNSAFLEAMAEICMPMEGAVNLLNALKGKVKLGIITNGFTQLQQIRLERIGLKDHFEVLVISEQIGIAKPNRAIFDHTLSLMGNPPREQVLMVGDNPDSDILGGLNAGLDTCWVNTDSKPSPKGVIPHYQVSSLHELETLLMTTLTA